MLDKTEVSEVRVWDKDFNGRFNDKYAIAEQFADREFVMSQVFDISVSGNIETGGARGLGVSAPKGALISDVEFDIMTALTSSGNSATLDVQFASADVVEASGVIVNDYAEASLVAGAKRPTLIPKKLSAASELQLQAGTEKFTAGKLRVFVKYYMARD